MPLDFTDISNISLTGKLTYKAVKAADMKNLSDLTSLQSKKLTITALEIKYQKIFKEIQLAADSGLYTTSVTATFQQYTEMIDLLKEYNYNHTFTPNNFVSNFVSIKNPAKNLNTKTNIEPITVGTITISW